MTALKWNATGERRFETGVDRGVLYTSDGTGVAWNGLVSVQEKPSGGTISSYYLDGIKFLNTVTRKEFNGTIEAYTYPDEFLEYDGWTSLANGLMVDEQIRKSFAFSYRTLVGNDVNSQDHGYKIHIVYGAMAQPSSVTYDSLGEDVDPITFAWDFTTLPVLEGLIDGIQPTSHLVIDSTKTNPTQLRFIEEFLYGTEDRTVHTDSYVYVIEGQKPTLPSLEWLFDLFASPITTLDIIEHESGINTLNESSDVNGDLRGKLSEGLYVLADNTRLVETETLGMYTLEI